MQRHALPERRVIRKETAAGVKHRLGSVYPFHPAIRIGAGKPCSYVARTASEIKDKSRPAPVGERGVEQVNKPVVRLGEVRMRVCAGLFGRLHQFGFSSALHVFVFSA